MLESSTHSTIVHSGLQLKTTGLKAQEVYQLYEIGCARPSTWAKYSAANLVIKTFTRNSLDHFMLPRKKRTQKANVFLQKRSSYCKTNPL